MSNRALRKLHGTKDDISSLASDLKLDEETEEHDTFQVNQREKKATNLFDLVSEVLNFITFLSSYVLYFNS